MTTKHVSVLHTYKNGGYVVTIHSDGTKIRKQVSNDPPVTPESIDLKITNECDLSSVCKWCHEESVSYGDRGNLQRVLNVLSDLPSGAELAIGGGNALTHPNLIPFLHTMQARGIICNMTVNQRHVNQYKDLITELIKDELIHGLGISKAGDKSVAWLYDLTPNVVFHVIAGINTFDEILMLPKVLILGYKFSGKGKSYFDRNVNVELNIAKWCDEIQPLLGSKTISFDNLALSQLNIKRHLTDEKWNEIYMGEDATFTYYIDAVRQRFGLSSTIGAHYSLMNSSAEMLNYVRNVQNRA